MSEVSAILLAAGRSARMGAFKPLLPFGKTTVVRSGIQSLREAGVEDIVMVLGHRAKELQENLGDLRLHFALNPDATSEMSASIACGLRELPPDARAALIALTDQPAVPPDVIRAIVSEWISGERLVIPEFQGRGGHPVLVDLRFREELLNLDSSGGLGSFFKTHQEHVRRLSVNSPFIARDMDTWDDYCALHEEVFGIQPDLGP
ncbi:MAG: nucleotidyltransferase family protein [Pyrinomonadaceae bacterium]|nr:nucleotidyltransferase family protein [Pyrinomonadaceae bacterium]MBA3570637.1 nucleotidyltransferase family protein [Pyrinomonadaceae bacterium]MDQ3174328.1 nucleotidyltransferase family protein [Acidobacteriota bacterium]